MKNKGLTLIELMVAMTIGGIILLALTCQFVAEQTFRAAIGNQVAATDNASITMRNMIRVLRYARQSTIVVHTAPFSVDGTDYDTGVTATIDRVIANSVVANDNLNNLPEFKDYTTDPEVVYGRKADSTFKYQYRAAGETNYIASTISNYITDFPVTSLWWAEPNKSYKILTIQLTAAQGNKSSSLESKIRVLGS